MDVLGTGDGAVGSEEDRLLGLGDVVAAVGSFYERGVERDDVEQAAQAELFLEEKFRDAELWQ